MLAISLWQPWASLWAAGVKAHETRSWRCDDKLGQVIAIHAAKALVPAHRLDVRVVEILCDRFGADWQRTLPRGAIVGTGKLVACWRTAARRPQIEHDEWCLGDWSNGRYAWQLAEARPLAAPMPFAGRQSWFDVPAQILAAVTPAAPAQGALL